MASVTDRSFRIKRFRVVRNVACDFFSSLVFFRVTRKIEGKLERNVSRAIPKQDYRRVPRTLIFVLQNPRRSRLIHEDGRYRDD